MAISLKHKFTSPKIDGPDATLVQPSNWNDEHELLQLTARILGRLSPGDGATEELTAGDLRQFLLEDDQAAARTALGATAIGEAIFTAADEAAVRNAIGFSAAVDAIFTANPYFAKVIGEPFPLWTHLSGVIPPNNSGAQKYIRLRAGQSYNSGLLASESVSGSSPLVQATAVIAVGPLAGQTVRLLETEQSFLRAGSSGSFQQDQMQTITGSFQRGDTTSFTSGSGAFSLSGTGRRTTSSQTNNGSNTVNFNSSNSSGSRTGSETRPKNVQASYYMRIV